MTAEEKRAYKREWQRRNPDKVKEYKRRSAIKKAIEDYEAGKVQLVTKTVLEPIE